MRTSGWRLSIDLWDEARRAKVEAVQWKVAQELLALGLAVIIEWGTWAQSERDTLRLRARELGATLELHYVSATVDVLFERIQRRAMENPPIGQGDLPRWMEIFEAPTLEEMALFDKPAATECGTSGSRTGLIGSRGAGCV